jgi:uncharacterized RDD family membrane protein YckC
MNEISPRLSIRTPEGITFRLTPAGPVPRFLAWLIDAAGIMVAAACIQVLVALFRLADSGVGTAVGILSYFLLSIGYGMFFEWTWNGQTPGKRLLRLRVMDSHGLRLQFSHVVIRNLLRSADMLPGFYFLGGTVSVLTSQSQRLGDIAANTLVIRIPNPAPLVVEELVGKKYNSLRDYLHLAARLCQTVTPEEAALALDAVRRAQTLEGAARTQCFEDLADYFKGIVEFPPEATEFVGAEQFIRNVVDIVYRKDSSHHLQKKSTVDA